MRTVKIVGTKGHEVLDSRGNPIVEADVILGNGIVDSACAPSGVSTGSREALKLHGGDKSRYLGKDAPKAVANINDPIRDSLLDKDAADQKALDRAIIELDGIENKTKPDANVILAMPLTVAKTAAQARGVPLCVHIAGLNGTPGQYFMPVPMMNIISGGEHADNDIDIQEFMVQPVSAKNLAETLRMGAEIFHYLKAVLKARGLNIVVDDEGDFIPSLSSSEDALAAIAGAAEKAGHKPGNDVTLALNCASSESFKDSKYGLKGEGKVFGTAGFADYLAGLTWHYSIVSIESGMDELDWAGWKGLTGKIDAKVQLVGDDLFVTNTKILREGIEKGIGNSILIKFNQIGSLTETLEAIQIAKAAGYTVVISHRSGEAEDSTIADLVVGTVVGQIKTGSLYCPDRVSKYNQLLHIEEQLGARTLYRGHAESRG